MGYLKTYIVGTTIFYMLFSFLTLNMNPFEWGESDRGAFVAIEGLFFAVLLVISEFRKD